MKRVIYLRGIQYILVDESIEQIKNEVQRKIDLTNQELGRLEQEREDWYEVLGELKKDDS